MTRLIASVGIALLGSSVAMAGSTSFSPNLENIGGDDPDGSGGATPTEIWSMTFALPALSSIDGASFELAHSFLSDMHLTLTGPGGEEFIFARGRSLQNEAPYNAPFDGSALGDGGSSLAGVANYNFAETGDVWNDDENDPDPTPDGTFASVEWVAGGFAAGDWTISIVDAWDSIDDGAIGTVSVHWTEIPAPGAVALLGLGGLVARRRR